MNKTHKFLIRRRKKMIFKDLPLIFGIAGVARCGKDTLGKHLIYKLNRLGFPAMHFSFAMELKRDLDMLPSSEATLDVVDSNIKIKYKVNSDSCRSNEFNNNNVLILGCSHTFGSGLPVEMTWPSILGKKINEDVANLEIGRASCRERV